MGGKDSVTTTTNNEQQTMNTTDDHNTRQDSFRILGLIDTVNPEKNLRLLLYNPPPLE